MTNPVLLCIFGSWPSENLCPRLPTETEYVWHERYADLLSWHLPRWVVEFLGSDFPDLQALISGCAPGADRAGEIWAESIGLKIHPHPAEWQKFGSGAGTLRNIQMAKVATHFLGLWDGESPGTKNMIRQIDRQKKAGQMKVIELVPGDFL